MRLTLTTIVGIDTRFELVCAQQPVCCRYGTLPMAPWRFDGVEPWACARQLADHAAHTDRAPLDLLIVLAAPVPHSVAPVPRGLSPDEQHRGAALGRELCGAPRQPRDGDRTHGAARDKPEPPLARGLRPGPPQEPLTGQRLGSGVVQRSGQLLQGVLGIGLCPTMLVGLGQPTPPDCVATAQRPPWLCHGPLHQAVAPFFCRR